MPLVSCRISELESSVDRLHKEVEQLREQRNQQKQLADSNARQRDMYKALLTQSTGFSLPPQGDKKILRPVCSIFVGEYTHSQAFIFIYLFCLQLQVKTLLPNLHRAALQYQLLALLLRELLLQSRHRMLRQKQL